MHLRITRALAVAAALSVSLSSVAGAAQPTASSNVAVAQCNVVRGMMASVPMWRDNGVPMSRAWFNVAGALSPFAPDPGVMRQWERAVSQIYGSSITSADFENRYQSLCEPYQRLAIPAPLPR